MIISSLDEKKPMEENHDVKPGDMAKYPMTTKMHWDNVKGVSLNMVNTYKYITTCLIVVQVFAHGESDLPSEYIGWEIRHILLNS